MFDKKKKRKEDNDYLNSSPNIEKTVELKTEDIATNSKKNIEMLDNFVKNAFKKYEED